MDLSNFDLSKVKNMY
ncbi:hypothetical protein IKN40_05200 [bacterium]|nr:hypothetical protein [bacterium]